VLCQSASHADGSHCDKDGAPPPLWFVRVTAAQLLETPINFDTCQLALNQCPRHNLQWQVLLVTLLAMQLQPLDEQYP
jgi:hypothetical protein